MYLKLDSSFSNYKINFITYLRIQPFFCYFSYVFHFFRLVENFLWETFQASAQPFRQVPRLNNFTSLHCAQQFPHPLSSALFASFLIFFSCRPGRKWKKCLFFGAWAIWKQSLSFLFSSHSQCSHLLSQGNAVTGTFAQAVAIWTGMSKQEHGRQHCPPGSVAAGQPPPVMKEPLSGVRRLSPLLRQGRLLEAQECTGECRSLA